MWSAAVLDPALRGRSMMASGCLADRFQRRRRVRGEPGDQPGDHGIGSDRPEQRRLSPQHADVGQAIPA
jgi:hypothetical protein